MWFIPVSGPGGGGGGGGLTNPLAAGTLAANSLQIVDAGTGLWQPSTHNLGIAANGVNVAQMLYVASGVNWFTMVGAAAGGSPNLSVAGSDTDIGINLSVKGAGSFAFNSGVNAQLVITSSGTLYQAGTNGFECIGITSPDGTNPAFIPDRAQVGSGFGVISSQKPCISAGAKPVLVANAVASSANYLNISPGLVGTPYAVAVSSSAAITTTQAGVGLSITADPAIAGSSVNGAAAGGNVVVTAGAAARLVSGNANGGGITLTPGAGIGTGVAGTVQFGTGAGNALFASTGVLGFVALDNTHPAFTYVGTSAAGGTSLALSRGDNAAFQNLIVGGLQIASNANVTTTGVNALWDLGRSENTYSKEWMWGWANVVAGGTILADADTSFTRDSAGVVSLNAGRSNAARGWIHTGGESRVSTQFDKTSDTALADVTGLTAALISGSKYGFRAVLYTVSDTLGGVQFSAKFSTTVTSIIYEGLTYSGGLITQTRSTSSAGAVGGITAVSAATAVVEGFVNPSANGNLTIQFAQNASKNVASSILVGSNLKVWDIA